MLSSVVGILNQPLVLPGLLVLTVALGVLCWRPNTLPNRLVSEVLNVYLNHRYKIRSVDGTKEIPSRKYQFPNGQGNESKFFDGERFSNDGRAKYGPIYRIWSGTTPEIVLTSPEHIAAVYKDSNMHTKGENMDSGWLLGEILGKCIGLLNKDHWMKNFKIFSKHFDRRIATTYLPLAEARIKHHLDRFESTQELSPGVFLFRTSEDLKLTAFLAIADVLFGRLTPELEEHLLEIMPVREKLWLSAVQGGPYRFSLSRFLPTQTNRSLRWYQRNWTQFIDKARSAAQEQGLHAPIVSLVEAVENNELTRQEMLQTLDEILFANLDVTVGNFSWNPMFLAADPKLQEEVYREIIQNTTSDEARQSYITRSDTLITACLQESARIKPMAGFSLAQAAPTARVVGGYVIPAGVNYVADAYALNIMDPSWGKDNQVYRPQRFLEEEKGSTVNRYRYWRFGFGPRQCLGKNVADVLLKTMLMRMLERYQLRLRSDGEEAKMGDWARKPEVWMNLAMHDITCTLRT